MTPLRLGGFCRSSQHPRCSGVAMVRGRRGPAPQTAKREEFTRLISRGVSNAEACRIVGVNPRTGKRWRHGRAITSSSGRRLHYPPVIDMRKREISARYLSEEERIVVANLWRRGCTVRAIAVEVHRNPSTISRELRRNRDPDTGQYRPFTAQRRAADRRARPGRGKLVGDRVLRRFVAERLRTKWSPEQICQALRAEFPDEPERHLVPETVYQAVYRPDLGGLHRELPRALRTGRRRRKPHQRPDARRPGRLVDMTMIGRRPVAATDRAEPGHWEGDLITGAGNRFAVGTVVERSPRVHRAAAPPRPAHRRGGPGRVGGSDEPAPRAAASILDVGPGLGDGAARRDRPDPRHAGVLLRGGQPVAAAVEREHEWVAPPVLSEGQRPERAQSGTAGGGCRRAERPTAQDPRLGQPIGPTRRAAERCSGLTPPWRRCEDRRMADMRRRSAEPPPGPPHVQLTPGLANEMLHELAPLLAEDGIDVDAIDVPDLDTLHRALTRAVERRNLQLFSPVGAARDVALGTLRRVVEAILDGHRPRRNPPRSGSAGVAGQLGRHRRQLHRRRPGAARRLALRGRRRRAYPPRPAHLPARRALDR